MESGVKKFPLDFYKEATGAAIAGNGVREQGASWSLQRQLLVNQHRLGVRLYKD